MRVLLISSAVAALGDGKIGGVSEALSNTALVLHGMGHAVEILTTQGAMYQGPGKLIMLAGRVQPSVIGSNHSNAIYPIVGSSLLARYMEYAYAHRKEYHVIINFCHDWLPYYLTPFFDVPLLHMPSIADENAVVTEQIQVTAKAFPGGVGVLTYAQARALGIDEVAFECGFGIPLDQYAFASSAAKGKLLWCARIAPEKGLEDAVRIAERSGAVLRVCGYMQSPDYYNDIKARYPDRLEYAGFLDRSALAREMARAQVLLCTHQYMEALGIVVLEALACGTPVITYDRGGPAEIIQHGKTGFVVPAGDWESAASYVDQLSTIKRSDCRAVCEARYSLDAYARRISIWLEKACPTANEN